MSVAKKTVLMTGHSFAETTGKKEEGKQHPNQTFNENDSCVDGVPLNTQSLRKAYVAGEEPFLLEKDMLCCPFAQFNVWFGDAVSKTDLKYEEVNVFALSTVSSFKTWTSQFENAFAQSKKGKELAENPFASALFYWSKINRQVRVEGRVEMLGEEVAEVYWLKRPIESRIGSKLSDQSSVIPSRECLALKQRELEELCTTNGEAAITRPSDWLGYSLRPTYFEFWQGQNNRVHDRIVYTQNSGETEWKRERLSP
uniref:pyridoxal 5'-phosphate synthase n=1 Tax=Globodera rostochiensis TaxID=31243 RepID=A0A914I9Q9_GLORO